MKADKVAAARLIKTARGQMDGLLRMIDDDRYCLDIYHQLLATRAILRKASQDVMQAHLESCVRDAFESGQEKEKIAEILDLIQKMTPD